MAPPSMIRLGTVPFVLNFRLLRLTFRPRRPIRLMSRRLQRHGRCKPDDRDRAKFAFFKKEFGLGPGTR